MSSLVITIDTNKDPTQFYKVGQKNANGNRIIDLIRGLNHGSLLGSVFAQGSSVSPVSATGTITLVSPATDTFTIGKTSLVAGTDFSIAGTDAEDATALAAAINAHATLSTIVSASAASNVVTISALQKGVLGNYIALTKVGASASSVSAGGYLSGGLGGAASAAEQIV
jgi:hypothetical protein